jgi:hypothetical protein
METTTSPDQTHTGGPVRCPVCAEPNSSSRMCKHVRWTFDQGGPIEFAQFALETSPYVRARGHKASEISSQWYELHGDWIVEQVLLHFDASDGFVFGELAHLDLLARDIWKQFQPEIERPVMHRVDPF